MPFYINIHIYFSLLLATFFLNPINSVAQQPSCADGIQNRDEVGVDCGGVFCADCDRQSIGLQRVSTTNLCLYLSHDDVDVKWPSLAISDNGERFVLGFENDDDGTYHVYTGMTDGSESQQIYVSDGPWSEVLFPIVNISNDGEKVLWSDTHYDGIYVANYDGSNRFKIAEEHTSEIGNMRTYINAPIMFNTEGDKVIFRNYAGGQINLIYRNGIFQVGLNQVVAEPLVINKDLQERYEEEIDYYSSNDIVDFVIDDQDHIVFSSNVLGGRYYGDLFMFEGSDFNWMGIQYIPTDYNNFDISSDGNFLAWHENHPDSSTAARVYKRNLLTDDQKYYYFEEWWPPKVYLNHNGELMEMHPSSGSENSHLMINGQDQIFASMHVYLRHGLRRLFDAVIGLSMSAQNERIIFAVNTNDNRNSFEVWSVDWTPDLDNNNEFSQLSSMNFSPEYAVYEDDRQYSIFEAEYNSIYPVPEWMEYMSYYDKALTEEGIIWFPLLKSTRAGTGYDRLSNDGMSQGDEAVDNIFTEDRMYPNYDAVPDDTDIANGSIRINLYTNEEFNITSYDYSPFTVYHKGSLVSITNAPLPQTRIISSLDENYIRIENNGVTGGPCQYRIYSMDGRLVKEGTWYPVANSSIDISTLNTGHYVFQLIDNKGRHQSEMSFVRVK